MSRNSSGVYSLPVSAFVPQTTILSADMNSILSDIATALTQSLATTGVSTMTAPLKAASGSAALPSYTFAGQTGDGFYSKAAGQIGISLAGSLFAYLSTSGLLLANGVLATPPVGSVMFWGGTAAPSGWLLTFGQNISRTTYAGLFTAYGTNFGVGDGSTTFGLFDGRGRSIFGKDNMGGSTASRITVAGGNFDATVLGGTGGAQNHTLTTAELSSHSHTYSDTTSGQSASHSHTYTLEGAQAAVQAGGSFFASTPGATSSTGLQSVGHTHTFSGSTATAGSGSAHTVLSPALILNMIVYTGVP